jgi:endonuclease YncB( thermonuclease family)
MSACHALVPLVGLFVHLLPSVQAATPCTIIATVEPVSDGDTITAPTSERTKLRIRLLGIDAPRSPTARSRNSTGLERGFR